MGLFTKNKKNNQINQVVEIPLKQIEPNRFQPRKVFQKQQIEELAQTIKEHGLLQPIILREFSPQKYEIIAGERRFRAMQTLNFEKAPAIVQTMDDHQTASMALIENLQREELTAIEQAQAYESLMQLNELTQSKLAEQLGKSQSAVANKLRLLKLAPQVKEALLQKQISERHGRALLKLSTKEQADLLLTILKSDLTVKETEKAVLKYHQKESQKTHKQNEHQKNLTKDTRVAINTLKKSIKIIQDNGYQITTKEEKNGNQYRMIIDIQND